MAIGQAQSDVVPDPRGRRRIFVREPSLMLAPSSTPVLTDAVVVRRLWIVLVIYEALVISIVAGAGLNIALMGGGSIAMAAPLALIACAEALRIPLSAMATRLRWGGQVLAAVALLAIAIGSAEGLAVALEAFLENRVVDIMRANGAVERAQRAVDQISSEWRLNDAAIASLAGEVTELDAQVAALAKSIPPPPAASNKTCTWRGQRVSCSADGAAIATYREAMKAYDARLTSLSSQRAALQAKVTRREANRRQRVRLGLQTPFWRPSKHLRRRPAKAQSGG
jgi:prefoldin subunit 5